MANAENEHRHLNKPIPKGETRYTEISASWRGLNRSEKIDSGYLSDVLNLSLDSSPYLETSPKPSVIRSGYDLPISIHAFNGFYIVVYAQGGKILADYVKGDRVWTGTINESDEDMSQRCIIQFNVYSDPSDPVSGTFARKLICYPDKVSFDFAMDETEGVTEFTVSAIDADINHTPDLKHACVYLSRVFGVDDARIYASAFNDYTNWNLDTADEESSGNAWVSTAQSNVKADNDFMGVIVYGGTVVAFKRDFMHEIYNNKNPFRVGDVYAEGTIDMRSVQDVGGYLIFVSDDNVKIYTGGNPSGIGSPLGIRKFTSGIAGSFSGNYYLGTGGGKASVFRASRGMWTVYDMESDPVCFASDSESIYTLSSDGKVRQLNTSDYNHAWYLETDLSICSTLDIKRLKSLQILADIGTGANVKAYALKESETFSEESSQLLFDSKNKTGNVVLRCMIRKTAGWSHRIRICGTGYVKLYAMQLRYSAGGERFV